MDDINWDEVQEQQPGEFVRPAPGGYIARIVNVEDRESKKDLKIEWDFEEGEFKGSNAHTFSKMRWWPTTLYCSYKPEHYGYFKTFKTSVELSNRGYTFRNDPPSLEGKLMGVVLGEEEYISKNGELRTRLYVYQVRSVKAIRDGDFKVPELKKLPAGQAPASKPAGQFQHVEELEDDDDCPF